MGKIANWLTNYSNERPSFGKTFRASRIQPFKEMIEAVHQRNGCVSILDIGGTVQYWRILGDDYLERFNVRISLINKPAAKIFEDTRFITHNDGDATGPLWETYRQSDFDLIHSNSVIEHVGDWENMKRFASNITSFKGGYFIQTPNFWFPIEPHCMTLFFHWLPKPTRLYLVQKKALGHWKRASNVSEAVDIVDSARLLNKAQFSFLFPDAEIISEKLTIFSKSFIAIRRVM